ncbi:mbp-1 interacting protein-2a family protein [Babesia caballi]|uniref:Mbp-1 interacting protein-2a family protein n=1 Tax=Babesia caballi TaxID=5871 RepID=A0AAV4LMG2_BABCB|nr:mbp-1 interacting protein-2a family protein [Babesia caballi]
MVDLDAVPVQDGTASGPKSKILVLVIVGRDDRPLVIQDLSTPGWRPDPPHLASFVAHQALDVVDDLVWTNSSMYLAEVDVFDCLAVWAFVSASHTRFLLVTRAADWTPPKAEDAAAAPVPAPPSSEAIRLFFKDVHELYCKYLYNPLYAPDGMIVSRDFGARRAHEPLLRVEDAALLRAGDDLPQPLANLGQRVVEVGELLVAVREARGLHDAALRAVLEDGVRRVVDALEDALAPALELEVGGVPRVEDLLLVAQHEERLLECHTRARHVERVLANVHRRVERALAAQHAALPAVEEHPRVDVPQAAHGGDELVVVPDEAPVVKKVHEHVGQRGHVVAGLAAAGVVHLEEAQHHAVEQVGANAAQVGVVEVSQLKEELDEQYERLHVLELRALYTCQLVRCGVEPFAR